MPRPGITTTTGSQLVGGNQPPRVLRFLRSERFLHWALAVPFVLLLLPPIVLLRGRSEWRTHLANLKEGWVWSREDFRWLILFPKAALNDRIKLPDQGKFNAAEKLAGLPGLPGGAGNA